MPHSASFVYPLIAVLAVTILSLAIKLLFRSKNDLVHHQTKTPNSRNGELRATYMSGRTIPLLVFLLSLAVWASWQSWSTLNSFTPELKPFYIAFGLLFLVQLLISATIKPFKHRSINQLRHRFETLVLVPVYNEDPRSLSECLDSLLEQTVLPSQIQVVDDGSKVNYSTIKDQFELKANKLGVGFNWIKKGNGGKRSAHILAFQNSKAHENLIVITVDSDGVLDPHAIEEGLLPFYDPTIKSVAGVVIAKNAQKNLLSRITDLYFVSAQQLVERSAMSQVSSVLVNSGCLAFYRSEVIQKAIDAGYGDEVFFGRGVNFSDDSFLTLFALLDGRAVQQPTAIVFADMPTQLGHHIRQQLRWNRGSFIRGWWRLRHLPVSSVGFWRQLIGWLVFFSATVILAQVFLVLPLMNNTSVPVELLLIAIAFGYVQSLRYFSIKRSDMSFGSQLLSFLLSPLATLWATVVLRLLRLYGYMTCRKTEWGTRAAVELVR